MLILLPPSEGKTAPTAGPALDFSQLRYPQFNGLRKNLADELIEISGRENALDILQAGASVSETVFAQTQLYSLPCAPARDIYTGVLFEALDFSHATPSELAFAAEKILIFSGLFGILSPNDSIPAYRLAMGTKLPNLGNNKTLWKHELKDFSAGNRELVIDCRSGSYQVWNPPESADWITVTAVRDKNGQRKVISHNAKYFRGLLANALIKSQIDIEDGEQLTEFVLTNLAGNSKIDSAELTPAAANGARKLILVQKC